ncbi:MAG: hypothetical protein PHT56_04615 [Candidatus Izemoplasmatales bacterium]|nr:hypothetical protein [Candidatus Izemoplasmatales bacterium]
MKRWSWTLFICLCLSVGLLACREDSEPLHPTSTVQVTTTSQISVVTTTLTHEPWLVALMAAADSITLAELLDLGSSFRLPKEMDDIRITWTITPNEHLTLQENENDEILVSVLMPAGNEGDITLFLSALFQKGTHSYLRDYPVALPTQTTVTRYSSVTTLLMQGKTDDIIQIKGYVAELIADGLILLDATGHYLPVDWANQTNPSELQVGDHLVMEGVYSQWGGGGRLLGRRFLRFSQHNSLSETVADLEIPQTIRTLDPKGIQGKLCRLTITPKREAIDLEEEIRLIDEWGIVAIISNQSPETALDALISYLDREITITVRYLGVMDQLVEVLFCEGDAAIIPTEADVAGRLLADWNDLQDRLDLDHYVEMVLSIPVIGPNGSQIAVAANPKVIGIEMANSAYLVALPANPGNVSLMIELTLGNQTLKKIQALTVLDYELIKVADCFTKIDSEYVVAIGETVFLSGQVAQPDSEGFFIEEGEAELWIQCPNHSLSTGDTIILKGVVREVAAFEEVVRYLSAPIIFLKRN